MSADHYPPQHRLPGNVPYPLLVLGRDFLALVDRSETKHADCVAVLER
jgi:hypothetical protein